MMHWDQLHTSLSFKFPIKTTLCLAGPQHLRNISSTKISSNWFMATWQPVNSMLGYFSRVSLLLCQSGTITGNRASNFKIKKLFIATSQVTQTTTLTSMQIVPQTAMHVQIFIRLLTSTGLAVCIAAGMKFSTKLVIRQMPSKVVSK